MPAINKNRNTPSDITVSVLTKGKFKEWVKDRIAKLKGQPVEIIRYKIRKEILNFNLPFWEEQKNLKKRLIENKKILEKDAETLVNNIEGFYEAFRLVCGMLIGLFDLIEDNYDDNLVRSYYGDKSFLLPREAPLTCSRRFPRRKLSSSRCVRILSES